MTPRRVSHYYIVEYGWHLLTGILRIQLSNWRQSSSAAVYMAWKSRAVGFIRLLSVCISGSILVFCKSPVALSRLVTITMRTTAAGALRRERRQWSEKLPVAFDSPSITGNGISVMRNWWRSVFSIRSTPRDITVTVDAFLRLLVITFLRRRLFLLPVRLSSLLKKSVTHRILNHF